MGWRHSLRGRAWALWGVGLLLSAAAAGWAHLDWRARVQARVETGSAEVANRLEEARALSGLSRQELADQVEVHYQTIGYIERGEYSPSLVLALRIAAILKVRVEEIFWLDEESK